MSHKILTFFILISLFLMVSCSGDDPKTILVFTKTESFRHESISSGIELFEKIGKEKGIPIVATEDSDFFKEKNLKDVSVVVFLNTTGDILDRSQQYELQRFIQAGGSFLGIHAAADTEYDWPWYNGLVGAYFNGHPNNPNVRDATVELVDGTHSSCTHLPDRWDRTDEWYNYKSINENINVVLNLDESSYEGGTNGENHPIAWFHEYDGGKAFYTGGGHTHEAFSEELFVKHIEGALAYLDNPGPDYTKPNVAPAENRFQIETYVNNLNEPMELDIMPDGRIVFIQRDGDILITDPETGETKVVDHVEVWSELEDGLIGMALDPNYAENKFIYLYHSPVEESLNRLSRFVFDPDSETPLSESKQMLDVVTQRDECCHAGGSIEFDAAGNLYLSTGDNTNPHMSNGHAPIDEQPGRSPFDASKSSANTNDLRGKILRIKPTADGGYTIPAGNLFSGEEGRPEIYVMGCRNPYRISIDQKDGRLFWGEVGPDADKDSTKYGPKGYDEINMARSAGNFGWPFFIADNKAYKKRDFANDETSDYYDPKAPVNTSVNNTGAENLPPAQEAMLYYPYGKSEDFPDLGSGGRNAMAGPVIYTSMYTGDDGLPDYYDKKLLVYDWMRGWIKAVTFDGSGEYVKHEDFFPSQKWSNLIDIAIAPDGSVYTLEYGTGWFTQNEDARLSKLRFIKGNRQPSSVFEVDKTKGGLPMTVNFDAEHSEDPDLDKLGFLWDFGDGHKGKGQKISHTYETAGTYQVTLTVSDDKGNKTDNFTTIYAGNEPPSVSWELEGGNDMFYFPGKEIKYNVTINDKEDESFASGIAEEDIVVTIDFLEKGYDMVEIAMGHQALSELGQKNAGLGLMSKSDCQSCHKKQDASIGPSYAEIALKYEDDENAISYLSEKIINGGGGVWGETAMAAHPDLSKDDAETMANYIMSLGDSEEIENLPTKGSYTFDKNPQEYPEGSYILTASYIDRGAPGAERIMAKDIKVLRSPTIPAASANSMDKASKFLLTPDMFPGVVQEMEILIAMNEGVVTYDDVDLTGINNITILYTCPSAFMGGGKLTFHLDDPDSDPIHLSELEPNEGMAPGMINLPVTESTGKHTLYLKFNSSTEKPVASLLSLMFS